MKKSIAIIGEGETEWFYFESMRTSCGYPFKMTPDFPAHSDIGHILKLAKKKVEEEYDYIVCLIDMDRLLHVPKEMQIYRDSLKKKIYKKVLFIETSPCTEFWFLLHFLPKLSTKFYSSYEQLIPELRKYIPKYEKTKKYLKKQKLYDFLNKHGNLELAKLNSKKLSELSKSSPEDSYSYSEIYKVFQLLNDINESNK